MTHKWDKESNEVEDELPFEQVSSPSEYRVDQALHCCHIFHVSPVHFYNLKCDFVNFEFVEMGMLTEGLFL